jgi:hypothetical protein
MTRYSSKDYPKESMALAYLESKDAVKQLVYFSEKFGISTLIDGRFRSYAEGDVSLDGKTLILIEPSNYKVVRELFETAQKENRYLKYDDVKEYEIVYEFDGSDEAISAIHKKDERRENSKVVDKESEDEDEDDDEEIPDLTDEDIEQLRKEARARNKASEKIKFSDVPPALQELIHDLIERVENKIGLEDADICSSDIKGFIAGRYEYTQSELSSQMAKHLRMLT